MTHYMDAAIARWKASPNHPDNRDAESDMLLQLPAIADKRNGLCGYCRRGLTKQWLPDGRVHVVCPVACKPWMTKPGASA